MYGSSAMGPVVALACALLAGAPLASAQDRPPAPDQPDDSSQDDGPEQGDERPDDEGPDDGNARSDASQPEPSPPEAVESGADDGRERAQSEPRSDDGEDDAQQRGEEHEEPAGGPVDEEELEGQAETHLQRGRAHYDSGRFAEAAAELDAAYQLSGRPELLYEIFVARRNAGQLGPAIRALQAYLDAVPEDARRDALQARLQSMRRLYRQRHRGADPPAAEDGASPADEQRADEDESEGTDVEPEDEQDESTSDDGAGALSVDAQEDGGGSIAPWIVLATGGALMLGGATTGIFALRAESDLEDRCSPVGDGQYRCAPGSGFRDVQQRGELLATATDVLLITGLLTTGAGVALLLLLDGARRGGGPALPTPSMACNGEGCMGTLSVHF